MKYIKSNGPMRTREDIMKVPKVTREIFKQCAGFLRIKDGNNILDRTSVHPEDYELLLEICNKYNVSN